MIGSCYFLRSGRSSVPDCRRRKPDARGELGGKSHHASGSGRAPHFPTGQTVYRGCDVVPLSNTQPLRFTIYFPMQETCGGDVPVALVIQLRAVRLRSNTSSQEMIEPTPKATPSAKKYRDSSLRSATSRRSDMARRDPSQFSPVGLHCANVSCPLLLWRRRRRVSKLNLAVAEPLCQL
jgi:hypothetical protein